MSSAQKIVVFDVTGEDQSSIRAYFRGHKNTHLEFYPVPLTSENVALAKSAHVVSIYITSEINAKMFGQLPKLKLIDVRATGYDNIDVPSATKAKVAVANVPGYGETTVAEYAFALMLALMRKLFVATAQLQAGQVDHTLLTGMDLSGKTLGVIGTGKIGAHMVQIAHGFGMHTIGYDLFPNPELEQEFGFKYMGLSEVLRSADIVTLHAPATKDNHHMLGAKEFELMKHGSMLINTARGELVDTAALVSALTSRHLGGAALDVIEGEDLMDTDDETALLRPHAPKKYLTMALEHLILEKLPNVILSPHNAFNTHEALEKIRHVSCENMAGFLAGQPQNIVK